MTYSQARRLYEQTGLDFRDVKKGNPEKMQADFDAALAVRYRDLMSALQKYFDAYDKDGNQIEPKTIIAADRLRTAYDKIRGKS